MPAAPTPFNEVERLAALHALCLLDTPTDPAFDLITKLAAMVFKVPIAVISLVDEQRQWFKSKVGLSARETHRDYAFCAYALHADRPLVVLDALHDERFADNPLVNGPPHIRFYAGVPLVIRSDLVIGTLCIIGEQPRCAFTEEEVAILKHLGTIVLARIRTLQAVNELDPLTLLPNRARFEDDLRLLAEAGAESDEQVVAVIADVCGALHYRNMTNALGADYAEQFLRTAKDHVAAAIHPAQLYRVDTTTFGFTLTPEQVDKLRPVLEAISAGNNQIIEVQGIPQVLSYSVGAVRLKGETSAAETVRLLVAAAEHARDQGQVFSSYDSTHDFSRKRSFALMTALTEALQKNEQLSLHYQPRIDLVTGRCCGAEALLRWRHPSLGQVSPAEFVPLAEKTALMKRITRWVLHTGLRQAAKWQRAGHTFSLALNVSALDLDRVNFMDELWGYVETSGADPALVELEFTESALSVHPDRVHERLTRIRALGMHIAIDDFGTGYSNLNYLKKIPATSLKIDQSFVRALFDDERDSTIVRAMIRLGSDLGFRVVAEGIETQEAMKQLAQWGCAEGQGYWIAKPLPVTEFEQWLEQHPA